MKTLLTRTLPLLLCIAVGTALSWVSIYAFWFAVWTFHSVPAARACDAVGTFLLFPARMAFELMGQDQSALFYDPIGFSGTNGLVLGILFYCGFRAVLNRREHRSQVKSEVAAPNRLEAKVG